MIYHYPDGTTIEIGYGDAYPPGHVGQHTNRSETWVRSGAGPWLRTECRSQHRVLEWIKAAETAGEAMEVICPDWNAAREEPRP